MADHTGTRSFVNRYWPADNTPPPGYLREYQRDAVDKIWTHFRLALDRVPGIYECQGEAGVAYPRVSGNCHMTCAGKTLVILGLIFDARFKTTLHSSAEPRVLILCPQAVALQQLHQSLTSKVTYERFGFPPETCEALSSQVCHRLSPSDVDKNTGKLSENVLKCPVILTTQTSMVETMSSWFPYDFGLIICDEGDAHTMKLSKTPSKKDGSVSHHFMVLGHFSYANVALMSATFTTSDGRSWQSVFGMPRFTSFISYSDLARQGPRCVKKLAFKTVYMTKDGVRDIDALQSQRSQYLTSGLQEYLLSALTWFKTKRVEFLRQTLLDRSVRAKELRDQKLPDGGLVLAADLEFLSDEELMSNPAFFKYHSAALVFLPFDRKDKNQNHDLVSAICNRVGLKYAAWGTTLTLPDGSKIPLTTSENACKAVALNAVHVIGDKNTLTRGVNIPCLSAAFVARGVSYSVWLQILGRLLRPFWEESDALGLNMPIIRRSVLVDFGFNYPYCHTHVETFRTEQLDANLPGDWVQEEPQIMCAHPSPQLPVFENRSIQTGMRKFKLPETCFPFLVDYQDYTMHYCCLSGTIVLIHDLWYQSDYSSPMECQARAKVTIGDDDPLLDVSLSDLCLKLGELAKILIPRSNSPKGSPLYLMYTASNGVPRSMASLDIYSDCDSVPACDVPVKYDPHVDESMYSSLDNLFNGSAEGAPTTHATALRFLLENPGKSVSHCSDIPTSELSKIQHDLDTVPGLFGATRSLSVSSRKLIFDLCQTYSLDRWNKVRPYCKSGGRKRPRQATSTALIRVDVDLNDFDTSEVALTRKKAKSSQRDTWSFKFLHEPSPDLATVERRRLNIAEPLRVTYDPVDPDPSPTDIQVRLTNVSSKHVETLVDVLMNVGLEGGWNLSLEECIKAIHDRHGDTVDEDSLVSWIEEHHPSQFLVMFNKVVFLKSFPGHEKILDHRCLTSFLMNFDARTKSVNLAALIGFARSKVRSGFTTFRRSEMELHLCSIKNVGNLVSNYGFWKQGSGRYLLIRRSKLDTDKNTIGKPDPLYEFNPQLLNIFKHMPK